MKRMILAALLLAGAALAEADKSFALAIPPALADSGFAQYVLPRFSLKTGVRITRVGPDDPHDAAFGTQGRPLMEGLGQVWSFDVTTDDPDAERFAAWLKSDVGQRTVTGFAPEGTPLFSTAVKTTIAPVAVATGGDIEAGERASLVHCGRCHVVSDVNRHNSIGSTPSFAVLRALSNWEERFQTFYVLKPHAAFTQIEDVTLPFDATLPSPIAPIEMSLEDLEAILAFVTIVPAADLGAPIVSK